MTDLRANLFRLSLLLAAVVTTGRPLPGMAAEQLLPQAKIIGGADADLQQWQGTVAIVMQLNEDRHTRFCGGSLVAPGWVLTAAHCLHDSSGEQDVFASQITVISGVESLYDVADSNRLGVTNVYLHPYYKSRGRFDYDAALLELSSAATVDPMAYLDQLTYVGETVEVAGWGLSQVDPESNDVVKGSYADVLQSVEMDIVEPAVCQQGVSSTITDAMICAGVAEGGKDSCLGDSGGPLVTMRDGVMAQVGIVSFGQGCGIPGKYGVYTSVASLAEWISLYTEQQPAVLSDPLDTNPNLRLLNQALYQAAAVTEEQVVTARSGVGATGWLVWLLPLVQLFRGRGWSARRESPRYL